MRWYSALLHLSPRSFRVEYGDELIAVFRSQAREARGYRAGFRSGSTSSWTR